MLVARQPQSGWHVRSNMIATIDGAIRGASGTSVDISNDSDRAMLGMLRGISDAVIVGSKNALAQPYLPLPARPKWRDIRAAHVMPAAPRLVVVTNSGLPTEAACFKHSETRTIVITSERCPQQARAAMAEHAVVIVAGDDSVHFPTALDQLAELGLWRILCEGGPALLSAMSADDVLDEMCVTTAAIWSGSADTAMTNSGMASAVGPPVRMRLAHLLIDEQDYIYARWVRETSD